MTVRQDDEDREGSAFWREVSEYGIVAKIFVALCQAFLFIGPFLRAFVID